MKLKWSRSNNAVQVPRSNNGGAESDIGAVSACIFPPAPTMSAGGKEPHFFYSLFSFSRGSLLDWFRQIMLYSHWLTQTWRSTNACVPATDEAVVCTLIEPSNAGAY